MIALSSRSLVVKNTASGWKYSGVASGEKRRGGGGGRCCSPLFSGKRSSVEHLSRSVSVSVGSPRSSSSSFRCFSSATSSSSVDDPRIPATIITGFLGSGKTTLLNRILTEDHNLRIAVIENEFGEIGIDQELVELKETLEGEDVILLNNGCICCTVREDLVKMLNNLLDKKRDAFDHILIETTGLAHPLPIIGTFIQEPSLYSQVRLEGVVTMVDAKHVMRHLRPSASGGSESESTTTGHNSSEDEKTDEVVEQIAYADKIVLNKMDLVGKEELESIESEIRSINKLAEIQTTTKADVDYRKIFDLGGFDLEKIEKEGIVPVEEETHSHSHDHHHHHHENEHDHDHHHHHDHEHDHSISSVSFAFDGEFDLDLINDWMGMFLMQRAEEIYRMKGILAIQGWEEKFIFQAVHMQFEGVAGKTWSTKEKRGNKLVFIGKNLDRETMEKELKQCLVA
jgi:G3E family GTPase